MCRFDGLQARRGHVISVASDNTPLRDYVTEKVWEAMLAGGIPVYSGAPNAHAFFPGEHTYIAVHDASAIDGACVRACECMRDSCHALFDGTMAKAGRSCAVASAPRHC